MGLGYARQREEARLIQKSADALVKAGRSSNRRRRGSLTPSISVACAHNFLGNEEQHHPEQIRSQKGLQVVSILFQKVVHVFYHSCIFKFGCGNV